MSQKPNILISDEQRIIKTEFKRLLQENEIIYKIAYNSCLKELEDIMKSNGYNIYITDICLNGEVILEGLEKLAKSHPVMTFIIYTDQMNNELIKTLNELDNVLIAFRHQYIDTLLKSLNHAIQRVESSFVSPFLTKRLKKEGKYLTSRELEVLELISYGHTTNKISEKLFISPHTVESHRKKLFHKLDVKNVAELIRKGLKTGIIH